ncbi:VOC family protein [Flavobacterium sp. Fl-77]|uniref:VOC family protein n=1 Tax=Flavobacterium flavipigmentatum TaxID=2893884 RepID=A0AAJ2SCN8_9FLAO|nr:MULTISPECIES: VOC family protein [unclassified Flavobacterium]MDX6183410.1 VOC family protein [Flavobacterium sp. Fl-33]MDX6186694.1 VOC family protein [Flavobacterium sp. Fl-77]UFH38538.1 VOC family protein [Flavobacterium sp. F-70]
MKFKSKALIVKLSVSDVVASRKFYEEILGFKVDDKYTLNSGGNFGMESYLQMYLDSKEKNDFMLGLFKDISVPFYPLPETGSVPSFIVDDIKATLEYFISKKVVIDKIDGVIINTNTSDKGYVDKFFFFRDPDNNSLVIRENILK